MSGSAAAAPGRSASWGEPDHRPLSLRTTRSSSTPPKSIAPSRPLPIGDDSVKWLAGASSQTSREVRATSSGAG